RLRHRDPQDTALGLELAEGDLQAGRAGVTFPGAPGLRPGVDGEDGVPLVLDRRDDQDVGQLLTVSPRAHARPIIDAVWELVRGAASIPGGGQVQRRRLRGTFSAPAPASGWPSPGPSSGPRPP